MCTSWKQLVLGAACGWAHRAHTHRGEVIAWTTVDDVQGLAPYDVCSASWTRRVYGVQFCSFNFTFIFGLHHIDLLYTIPITLLCHLCLSMICMHSVCACLCVCVCVRVCVSVCLLCFSFSFFCLAFNHFLQIISPFCRKAVGV